MNRTYMVVYERVAEDNWGAWCPAIGGAVRAGDSLAEARQSLRAGMDIVLEDLAERHLPAPAASSSAVDFSELDPNPANSHYEIEWITIDLPETQGAAHTDAAKQAA